MLDEADRESSPELDVHVHALQALPSEPQASSRMLAVLSLVVGENVVQGFDHVDVELAGFIASLRALTTALEHEDGEHILEAPSDPSHGIRLAREGETVHITDLASRWQRADAPRAVDFRVEASSIARSFERFRGAVREALEARSVRDTGRVLAALFAPKPVAPAAAVPSPASVPVPVPAVETKRKRTREQSPPPKKRWWSSTAFITTIVLSACCIGSIGLSWSGKHFVDRFDLGYSPTGLVEKVRDGVRILEHPHLGFAIRHPGDEMSRAPDIEDAAVLAMGTEAMRVESIAYADVGRQNTLSIAIERIPFETRQSLEHITNKLTNALEREGHAVVFEETRMYGGARTFEGVFVHEDVYTFVSARVVRVRQGETFGVLLSATGAYPEAYRPWLDSFALRGRPLGRARTLDAERARFPTQLKALAAVATPAETPEIPEGTAPVGLVTYLSNGTQLHTYLSRDPGDGAGHPALLFAHGDIAGIGRECWEGALHAYYDAGFVVMCPSWRGEAGNAGRSELFLGELDDLRAAFAHLRALPYVDPDRIYVIGHSTGGTLALLMAASTDGIRAAVSIGGVPDVTAWAQPDPEDPMFPPYDTTRHTEGYVRSALHFMGDLRAPTFYVEGEHGVVYPQVLAAMKRAASDSRFAFQGTLVPAYTHDNVSEPALAALLPFLLADTRSSGSVRIAEDELLAAFPHVEPPPSE